MKWIIKKYNRYDQYALFLDTENERMFVGLFERLNLINDEILEDENTQWEVKEDMVIYKKFNNEDELPFKD